MNRKIFKITTVMCVILIFTTVCFVFFLRKAVADMSTEDSLVILNEIDQLTKDGEGNSPAAPQIQELEDRLNTYSDTSRARVIRDSVIIYVVFAVIYSGIVMAYMYIKILRPFARLERYAGQVAAGNLDIPLRYERNNMWGDFTWAFDHMREEIRAARKNEKRAVEENKTIIAALSHDIKTPIASIRAYSEGLEAGLDNDYEKRQHYLSVIMKKCDEVTALTNDLVLHSLSELDKLEIHRSPAAIDRIVINTIKDLEYPYISLLLPVPEARLMIDEKRMAQVIENILNNARKYAPGCRVDVWAVQSDSDYQVHIRDYGKGIMPEDMPFVCNKFYRGHNTGEQPGSGLGLYITSYILERMNGELKLVNHENGLEAVIILKIS